MKTITLEEHLKKIEAIRESVASSGLYMLIGSLILVGAFYVRGDVDWLANVLLIIGLLLVAIGYTGTQRS